jgi:hypothetical protein
MTASDLWMRSKAIKELEIDQRGRGTRFCRRRETLLLDLDWHLCRRLWSVLAQLPRTGLLAEIEMLERRLPPLLTQQH